MGDILRDTPAEGVCRLTLNRPDALNSLSYAMYGELIDHLEAVRYDHDVRVVLLTGAGRAFCAGHDTRAGGAPDWVDEGLGKAQWQRRIMDKLGQIPLRMRALPQPVICAVNGATAGAGYALALAADMTIAARSAKFVNAFHNAGTGHELGFSYMLPRLVGAQRAAELMLTGRAVMAEEAERIGLVLRCVDDERLMDEALALADAVMANSPIGIALTKSSMWINADAPSLEAAIELENRAIFMSQSTGDTAEKRKAFFEKRRPNFTGQ
ncbi:enoyl-CoA hydratase [Sphingomonas histidinilytica]|jgi:enoyl-CoA hydratase|uniref:Enoyl-CoA hydratase n=1 Tax=Rhizorhabdus histidinilytica TaxID=439228 RepID=A0A1T5A3V2_9SPHN|nr:enoyl-CoA hydratase-related protein [Rhizorhabdus histidinilytica]MBO9376159.1 enoyl-CoA hydratase [Rhizorhabdus histidinilytica]QEH78283.1 enoyl-CoA hydratase [Sphingomonas sp. C8-2]SKB29646.1 enoyl-CoA hydratase [Rhizorhabdus histidinilytica]